MPYLTDQRKRELAEGAKPDTAGDLTWELQQMVLEYVEVKGLRYQTLAECLGALEGCKADLVDRMLLPYEHMKRAENGDVWPSAWPPAEQPTIEFSLDEDDDQHHMGD